MLLRMLIPHPDFPPHTGEAGRKPAAIDLSDSDDSFPHTRVGSSRTFQFILSITVRVSCAALALLNKPGKYYVRQRLLACCLDNVSLFRLFRLFSLFSLLGCQILGRQFVGI